jgi:NADH-quinone oxidoreductase subunit H
MEIVLIGCLGATLFLGGWHIPGVSGDTPLLIALQIGAFLLKAVFLVWLQMTIRWTLPRFRYDQVMRLGWRIMLPAALVNLVLTGIALTLLDRR